MRKLNLLVILICAFLSMGVASRNFVAASGDGISCANDDSWDNLDAKSAFLWINPDVQDQYDRWVGTLNNTNGAGWHIGFTGEGSCTGAVYFYEYFSGTDLDELTDDNQIVNGSWQHFGFTKSTADTQAAITFYEGGSVNTSRDCGSGPAGSDSSGTSEDDSAEPMTIAEDGDGSGDHFDGEIAHVHVYNVECDAAKVPEIMNHPGKVLDCDADGTDDLVFYWAGEDGTKEEITRTVCTVSGTDDSNDGPAVSLPGGGK